MSEACNMRDNKCIGLHDFGWNTWKIETA
jgi:hypothetical protein